MKKFLFALAASLVFVLGCSKDDDDEPTNTVTIKNVSGNYIWTGFTVTQDVITVNVFPQVDACAKDDIINLKEDKTYLWPDGGVKCSQSQDQTGTWDLVGTTQFKLDAQTWNIDRFDGQIIEISLQNTNSFGDLFQNGENYTVTWKFQKQ